MPMRRTTLVGGGLALLLTASVLAYLLFFWTRTYEGRGRVAGVKDGGQTLVVEHEKIPGYMPAMTMPLPVKDSARAASLSPRQAIQFRLAVSDDSAWIESFEVLPDTAVARHPGRTVQPMPAAEDTDHPLLREGDVVPGPLSLTAQDGTPIQLRDFRGQALVLTFIYTRCPLPTYCPRMSKQFATLQPTLRDRVGDRAHLLSISFDPDYDTPAVLRDYASRYTDRLDTWTFATGDSTEIQRITSRFGVFTKTAGDEITHNLVTAVVGPEGTLRRVFRGNDWQPDDVLQAVERALR